MLGWVASEVTITVAPDRCQRGLADLKKRFMNIIKSRLEYAYQIKAYIVVYEEHKNGWSHAHAIVWFPKDDNNASCYGGGRVWGKPRCKCNITEEQLDNGAECKCRLRFQYLFNELGRTKVDLLRTKPYAQTKKKCKTVIHYDNWLEYILKEYGEYSVKEQSLIGYKRIHKDLFSFPRLEPKNKNSIFSHVSFQ